MRVGVISDSRGNIGGLLDAVVHLYNQENIDRIFLLGNRYQDFDKMVELLSTLRSANVQGQEGPQLDASWLDEYVIRVPEDDQTGTFDVIEGWILCATYDPKKLSHDDIASANFIFYGATGLYQTDFTHGRYFLNPGHMATEVLHGRPASYGVLSVEEEAVFEILDLEQNILHREPLNIDRQRKLSIS